MTNQELSAAIRDLDEQLEEFVREYEMQDYAKREVVNEEQRDMRVVREKGTAIQQSRQALQVLHTGMRQEGNLSATHGSSRQDQNAETVVEENKNVVSGLDFGHAPEPHQPTKWIGWLLVTFAAYCLGLLVMAIVRAK